MSYILNGIIDLLLNILWVGLIFMCYFAPSVIAHNNKKKNQLAIFFLNLLTGWTILGWVAALIWSLCKD